MNIFKKIFISLAIIFGLAMPILAMADPYGLAAVGETAGLKQLTISSQSIPQLAGQIVGVGLSLVGIIFFLLMLYAGIRWMIAMGKSEDVQKAKDTLEAAAIGLVIVLAAYAITQFVFTNLGVSSGGAGGAGGGPAGGGAGGNPVCFYNCSSGAACQEINDPSADLKVTMSDTCDGITDGSCADVTECQGNGTSKYCLNKTNYVCEEKIVDSDLMCDSPYPTPEACMSHVPCGDCCLDMCATANIPEDCNTECQRCNMGVVKYTSQFDTCADYCRADRAKGDDTSANCKGIPSCHDCCTDSCDAMQAGQNVTNDCYIECQSCVGSPMYQHAYDQCNASCTGAGDRKDRSKCKG